MSKKDFNKEVKEAILDFLDDIEGVDEEMNNPAASSGVSVVCG